MPGCLAIKSNNQLCRNWAMKGKTCCRVHQYMEDWEPEVDYFTELVANLNFVLENEVEFKLQERRIRVFGVCDKFVKDDSKWHLMRTGICAKLEEHDHFYRNGFELIDV